MLVWKKALFAAISIGFILDLYSCKQEISEQFVRYTDIAGRWELASAQVDGKDTDRLRSLYFVFLPDTSLQTNIFGSETNFRFSMLEDKIEQYSEPKLTYYLLDYTDTTIHVQTELRGKQFSMELRKAKPKLRNSSAQTPAD